jgi:hypothetical protein
MQGVIIRGGACGAHIHGTQLQALICTAHSTAWQSTACHSMPGRRHGVYMVWLLQQCEGLKHGSVCCCDRLPQHNTCALTQPSACFFHCCNHWHSNHKTSCSRPQPLADLVKRSKGAAATPWLCQHAHALSHPPPYVTLHSITHSLVKPHRGTPRALPCPSLCSCACVPA